MLPQKDIRIIEKYFDISPEQRDKFIKLGTLYLPLNKRINLISRKDIDKFYERHVLHSLAIAKFIRFLPESRILDVGTGGGFPGLPLSIMFPRTKFHLLDSTGKKIKAVEYIARELELKNVTTEQNRVENHHKKYDFIVSRAVTRMDKFYQWTKKNISNENKHQIPNGILYLKGGDLSEELKPFPNAGIIHLSGFFEEAFFETKKLVFLPVNKSKR